MIRLFASVELDWLYVLPGMAALAELSLKCALNTITTCAHIFAGKVYKNRMIGTVPFLLTLL